MAPTGVTVSRGPTLDGLGRYLADVVEETDDAVDDVAETLGRSATDVWSPTCPSVPSGRPMVCRARAGGRLRLRQLHPGVHRLHPHWRKRFEERGLPLIGDDIKSQVGATIVHRMLANLFRERGVRVDRTYQLNFGGNTDFLNMLERERLESKKISKTQAVTSQLGMPLPPDDIHVGPERPRALADRPQMGLYPPRRHHLRRGAAQRSS